MNSLKSTLDSIVIKLDAIVATNEASVVTSWHDITTTPTYDAGSFGIVTSGTSQVEIVQPPGVGVQRVIDAINVFNADTAPITGTISYKDDATIRKIWRFTLPPNAYALYTRGSGFHVYDESGRIVTVGVAGAAGSDGADGLVSVTEAELDFGASAVWFKTFTISDAGITSTSKIVAVQSGAAATDREADENETDALILRCVPATGSMTVYADALRGPVSGKFKINYVYS